MNLTATIKSNLNLRTTVNTNENGTARVMGVAGQTGQKGDQGDQGDRGEIGIIWKGDYLPNVIYEDRDVVTYLGSTYIFISTTPESNIVPTDISKWSLMAQRGSIGSDLTYQHTQHVADTLWIIDHNMSKNPSVSVIDTSGSMVEGEIKYISINTIHAIFNVPFTGIAYLN